MNNVTPADGTPDYTDTRTYNGENLETLTLDVDNDGTAELTFNNSFDGSGNVTQIVRDGVVLANAVSSQIKLHEQYGGVVPELATREHLKNLMPTARTAFADAGIRANEIDVIAATRGPGLPPALMIGLLALSSMSAACSISSCLGSICTSTLKYSAG